MTEAVLEADLKLAADLLARCEQSLGRELTANRVDLLLDNVASWSVDYATAIIASLDRSWGAGAFYVCEARRRYPRG